MSAGGQEEDEGSGLLGGSSLCPGCNAGWEEQQVERQVDSRPMPYLCTCRTKACTSWIRGS